MEEEGFYRNDSLHGQVKRWYSTGDPASVSHYKNGKLDSLMQVYSLSFELKKESFFKADNEIARIEYFKDNKIKEVGMNRALRKQMKFLLQGQEKKVNFF